MLLKSYDRHPSVRMCGQHHDSFSTSTFLLFIVQQKISLFAPIQTYPAPTNKDFIRKCYLPFHYYNDYHWNRLKKRQLFVTHVLKHTSHGEASKQGSKRINTIG